MAISNPFTVQWASGAAPGDAEYPTAGIEASGYLDGQPLPHEEFNGVIQRLGEWTVFLEDAFADSGSLKLASSDAEITMTDGNADTLGNLTVSLLDFRRTSLPGSTTFTAEVLRAERRVTDNVVIEIGPSQNILVTFQQAVSTATLDFDAPGAGVEMIIATDSVFARTGLRAPTLVLDPPSGLGDVFQIIGGGGDNMIVEYAVNLPTDFNRLDFISNGGNAGLLAVDNARLDGVIDFQAGSPTDPLVGIGQFTRTVGRQNICRAKCVLEFTVNGSDEYNAPTIVTGSNWNVESVTVSGAGVIELTLVDPAAAPVVTAHVSQLSPEGGKWTTGQGYDAAGGTVQIRVLSHLFGASAELTNELGRSDLAPGNTLYVHVVVH